MRYHVIEEPNKNKGIVTLFNHPTQSLPSVA